MTQEDQISYHKSVRNKLRTAQHRVEEYLDFMVEIKRFLDVREDRLEGEVSHGFGRLEDGRTDVVDHVLEPDVRVRGLVGSQLFQTGSDGLDEGRSLV